MTDVGKSLGDLSQRLSQIPEATLVELVWSLEGKRAGNHTDGTAVTLLGQFRPRLQLVRPVRRMTAKRLFALPFEDMLTNAPPAQPKIIGKIARAVTDSDAGLDAVRRHLAAVPQGFAGPNAPEQRRVLVHSSGFQMSPYSDIKPAGEDGKSVARKLWHRSPGSAG